MVISSCQIIGYIAGIATFVGSVLATALPDWMHNNYADESFGGITILRGLWASCNVRQNGAIECKPIGDPFFVLPNVLRGCRTMAVLASILSFFGVATTPLGMQCTTIGGDGATKSKLARLSSIFFGLSGMLIGAAVSWFAEDVAREFHKPLGVAMFDTISELKYVYGNSLFIGWGSMVMGIISAIFLALGSFQGQITPSSNASSNYEGRVLTLDSNAASHSKTYAFPKLNSKVNANQSYLLTTELSNGSPSGYAVTGLKKKSQSRKEGIVRKSSIMSAPPSVRTNMSSHAMKTYV